MHRRYICPFIFVSNLAIDLSIHLLICLPFLAFSICLSVRNFVHCASSVIVGSLHEARRSDWTSSAKLRCVGADNPHLFIPESLILPGRQSPLCAKMHSSCAYYRACASMGLKLGQPVQRLVSSWIPLKRKENETATLKYTPLYSRSNFRFKHTT